MEGDTSNKDTQEKRPKSILKHAQASEKPEVKWDEMNILETYHPANKDYGHMKINEPPTPYAYLEDSDGELDTSEASVDPKTLSESLSKASPPNYVHTEEAELEDSETDESKAVAPEELCESFVVHKKAFKDKRTKHYDEFSNVRKARELIAKELAELEKQEDDLEHQKMDTTET